MTGSGNGDSASIEVPLPFDRKRLLDIVDSDFGLLAEIVDLFLEDLPGWLESVTEADSNSDGEALYEAAHALRGALGNFAADQASATAAALEKLGRSGDDLEGAAALIETLERQAAELVNSLTLEVAAGR